MKHYIMAALVLPGALVLFQGCKRKAPNEATEVPIDTPSEVKAESGVEMVQLPGGRFTMGDENEVDAIPHEVVVSPFYTDKYLVTQGSQEKRTGCLRKQNGNTLVGLALKQHIFLAISRPNWLIMPGLRKTPAQNLGR